MSNETITQNLSTTQKDLILQFLSESTNITINDVLDSIEAMNRKKILEQQNEFCTPWLASDKRWKVKVPDSTKKSGFHLIAKSTRENLDNAIIEFYKQKEETEKLQSATIQTLYPIWKKQQYDKGRSSRTIRRYDQYYQKYYEGESIISRPMCVLTTYELENWCIELVRKHSMTRKLYYNVTNLIRGCFKLAYKQGIISSNPFADVEMGDVKFEDAPVYKDSNRVFLASEQEQIISLAMNESKKLDSLSGLGIVLCFYLGVRLGELAALKKEDIHYNIENYIFIRRMEVKTETLDIDGHYLPSERQIVNHTKTKSGLRDIYLTSHAREIIAMIEEWHEKHNITSEYLFVNKDGKRLYATCFDSAIRRYCRKLGIRTKRIHCIRRTYISKLFDGGVNISTIQQMAGHADKQTTLNNYVYDRLDIAERNAKIEKALG